MSEMTPSSSPVISFISFIASMIHNVCPFFTWSPMDTYGSAFSQAPHRTNRPKEMSHCIHLGFHRFFTCHTSGRFCGIHRDDLFLLHRDTAFQAHRTCILGDFQCRESNSCISFAYLRISVTFIIHYHLSESKTSVVPTKA